MEMKKLWKVIAPPVLMLMLNAASAQQTADTPTAKRATDSGLSDIFERALLTGDKAAAQQVGTLAEHGDPEAQALLALLYSSGGGVARDAAMAMQWFHKAAEKGNTRALNNLGLMYNWGPIQDGEQIEDSGWAFYGRPKDYVQAAQWYMKAAQQGDTFAQRQLGEMSALGLGTPKDVVTAYLWFNLAATKNDSNGGIARRNRDRLEKLMTPAQVAEAQRMSRAWKPTRWAIGTAVTPLQ